MMTMNDMALELILLEDVRERRGAAGRGERRMAVLATAHRHPRCARHPFTLWLGERLIRAGGRLRSWSAPDPRSEHAHEAV